MFPADLVTFNSMTRDHKIVIAEVESDRKPGDFLLIDTEAGKIAPLMQNRPALPSEKLAAMQPVEISTRDDATIYGYLTVPDEWQKPGPLVVWIHGDPTASATLGATTPRCNCSPAAATRSCR
ncbi:MAG: hypothetical protein OXH15_14160 [Gammaproteobacteria bacterium]|nr:hypothetical protein [Gammaproteobacteria bacterium]